MIGVELRAMFVLGDNQNSIDCWGPVVNLNRDPRTYLSTCCVPPGQEL